MRETEEEKEGKGGRETWRKRGDLSNSLSKS
jgi:hypothetical protein